MHSLKALLLATILSLTGVSVSQAQQKLPSQEKRECGSVLPPGQRQAELARKNNFAMQTLPPTDAPYYLPLTIHVVHNTDGTGGFTLDEVNVAMRDLNLNWKQVGVQFFIYGDIDHINDSTHYPVPDEAGRHALLQVNVVPNTINVYFTSLQGGLCGQASYTETPVQGVLISKNCAGIPSDPSTFAHEIGHYFNLLHTHETEAFGVECPSGNNCSTAGDLLCDTPADPNQFSLKWWKPCGYFDPVAPPSSCDMTAYNPPTSNLMSYARSYCLSEFTAQQIAKVLHTLRNANNRKNLINSVTRYVDPQASASNVNCTYASPCNKVAKAVEAARDGDFIFVKPGVSHESSLGGKRVTVGRWGTEGVVEIVP